MKWRIGTIGFGYKQWIGAFYPKNMRPDQYLTHYAQFFDTVEIDSTFYGIPAVSNVQKWRKHVPDDFLFCPKTPKSITHGELTHSQREMPVFLDTIRHLTHKLGAVLIQFPPSFVLDKARGDAFKRFTETLPDDLTFAIEFRDASWDNSQVRDWMRDRNLAWVCPDYVHLDVSVWETADILYYRFIGVHQQFETKDRELVDQTDRLKMWLEKSPQNDTDKVAYAYFNNDFSGHSPTTANRLKDLVGLQSSYPEILVQKSLL